MTSPFVPGSLVFNPKLKSQSIARREVSQGSADSMGLTVTNANLPVDPLTIQAAIYQEINLDDTNPDGALIATYVYGVDPEMVREALGIYSFTLSPVLTAVRSEFKIVWTYTLGTNTFTYLDYFIVMEALPIYDGLSVGEQNTVQQVSWRFGDLFDNTVGGTPNFEGEFQTHYGYERIAQMMYLAADKINYTKQPILNFHVGPTTPGSGGSFPTTAYGLLSYATYIEVLRHFIRTYVEQPNIQGAPVSFADRRDYLQRWQSVLNEEKEAYDGMLRQFKRGFMSLGTGRLIVAGGIFGGSGGRGIYLGGAYAAGVRGARFYPIASSFVNQINIG